MSAELVRNALELVSSDYKRPSDEPTLKKNKKGVFTLMPQDHKVRKTIFKPGKKNQKVTLLQSCRKKTVEEIIELQKEKKFQDRRNRKYLRLLEEACEIDIGEDITSKIIKRAVTRKPVHKELKNKEDEPSVFTEEDFKKFEEEHIENYI